MERSEALIGRANPIGAYAAFEDRHWWYVARRRILGCLARNLVEPSKSRLVLDVGCGPGANIASLACDYTCVGIDQSVDAIEQAQKRFPDVEFVCGAAPTAVDEIASSADLIMLMDVLEHIGEDADFLRSLIMHAKAGANFLITVPAEPRLWSPHDEAVGHQRRYTVIDLTTLWEGLPVTTRLVSPFNSRLYGLVRVARLIARARGMGCGGSGAEGTDLRLPPGPVNRALTGLFAGEAPALMDGLVTGTAPYRRGVSLLAVLRRNR